MADQARFDPANRPIGASHHPKLEIDRDFFYKTEQTQNFFDSNVKYLSSLSDPVRQEQFSLKRIEVSSKIPEGSKKLSQKTKHVAGHLLNRPNAPQAPNLRHHRQK